MPMTPEMRRGVDQIRDYLYGGGYPDPLSNAEQLSYLFFFYLVEGTDAANLRQARATKQGYVSVFDGDWEVHNPLNAPAKGQIAIPAGNMRWSRWARAMSGEPLVRFVRDEVFPFYAQVSDRADIGFMANARLAVDEPVVLGQTITLIDGLGLDGADADSKGDLFEHILRQVRQAGELGQFRTPRHIIRTIVEMVDPKIGQTVYDPAAGTAGFLVEAYNRIRFVNSSEAGRTAVTLDGKPVERGIGDKLNDRQWQALKTETLYGNDVDGKMVTLATMNLALRGLTDVHIRRRNVLTSTLDRAEKAELHLPPDGYDVILANPPFSGSIDRDRIVDEVKVGNTGATELLFLKYMLDSLKPGGRCGVVVPEGVLFGSTGAHKELRRQLIENNTVEAVLSLPGGVFQPYSGVKTSVLFFRKGGTTERVLFLHADNDGYKLDANHDTPIDADDLPDLMDAWFTCEELAETWETRSANMPWKERWWFADAATIRTEGFNLSASRHRPESHETVEHLDPRVLLAELREEVESVLADVDALMAKLAEVPSVGALAERHRVAA